jgi:hypothetical protein
LRTAVQTTISHRRAEQANLTALPASASHRYNHRSWVHASKVANDDDEHVWRTISGPVRKDDKGRLSSTDKTVNGKLQLLNRSRAFRAKVREMEIAADETLTFSLPVDEIEQVYQLFKKEYGPIDEVSITGTEEEGQRTAEIEDGVLKFLVVMVEIKNRGKAALKADASMESIVAGQAHPYDVLTPIKYQVTAKNSEALASAVQDGLADAKHEEAMVRHVSSHFIDRLSNSEYVVKPLIGSLIWTAVVSTLFEAKIPIFGMSIPDITDKITKKIFAKEMKELGVEEVTREVRALAGWFKRLSEVGNRALPYLLGEPGDMLFIGSAMRRMRRLPVTLQTIWNDVPNALEGGLMAWLLALPDEAKPFIEDAIGSGADYLAGAVTAPLAAFGGGFGLIIKLATAAYLSEAGVLEMYGETGPLALPDTVKDQAALQKHVSGLTNEAFNINPDTAIGRKSIIIAYFAGMGVDIAGAFLPPWAKKALKLALNEPIELWTMNFGVYFAKSDQEGLLMKELQTIMEQARNKEITQFDARTTILATIGDGIIRGMFTLYEGVTITPAKLLQAAGAMESRPLARRNQAPYKDFAIPAAAEEEAANASEEAARDSDEASDTEPETDTASMPDQTRRRPRRLPLQARLEAVVANTRSNIQDPSSAHAPLLGTRTI